MNTANTKPVNVIIEYNTAYEEYRVPATDFSEAGAYYTDDKMDAIDTCKAIWKDHGKLYIRIKRVW